jgi:hypothetical protein
VAGLTKDIAALKRLISYIQKNQEDTVNACYQFRADEEMRSCHGATQYLKFDGGRMMPAFMCENIINRAKSFNDFIRLHAAGKDGVSMGRPFRYAINTYCLKHTETIEFRCFRATVMRNEIESQFRFAVAFLDAALNGGRTVKQILAEGHFTFPPFTWSRDEYLGWTATKHSKERGTKKRQLLETQG